MFNFTEWLATASSVSLNNLYHPGNQPGVVAAARNGAYSVLQDMGLDVLREFWPEIARKFKMPFRGLRKELRPSRNVTDPSSRHLGSRLRQKGPHDLA
jgi:hypothetical protein